MITDQYVSLQERQRRPYKAVPKCRDQNKDLSHRRNSLPQENEVSPLF